MTITIKKEETGGGFIDYQEGTLLKKALEREGITDIYIESREWNGIKKKLFGMVKNKIEGPIPGYLHEILKYAALNVLDEDIVVNLDDNLIR